ncbi:MAG: hypothetical protein ACYTG0_05940 [Planctomycetota bacterium]|jgi:hypothetical protein
MRLLTCIVVALCALATSIYGASVQVVSSPKLAEPARYGIGKLCNAITSRGFQVESLDRVEEANGSHVIVGGLASEKPVATWITEAGLAFPEQPESLAVRHIRNGDRHIVVLCGADPVGLMYASLDTAERIRWAAVEQHLFAHVRGTSESPRLVDRSVSTYTMQRRWFEQRLHDPSYWEQYFDMLAASRINGYVIIFGYECGGFMAPLYPYFFDVEEFPEVELTGITDQQQTRNAAALRRVIRLAHQRGISITIGIWDHIYRGGVQGGGIVGASELVAKRVPHLVHGVTGENLPAYTKAALRKLLTVFPDIDGIQFRMHWESGLTREETPRFWHEVFAMLHELNPAIRFDLRAKGLPDVVIEDAIDHGLPFRIATKYWMEQLGMPFHPTHINPQNQRDRRHGYADLLRYPKGYGVHWRVWSGGTARFLLWGDPEYVGRFVESARIYGGNSFEVNEMLATKMLGEPHDAEPFQLHTPAYRHYDYEFERYWHYYQVWGRVSYNPQADPEIWQREFVRRFGDQAGPLVMRALERASHILPRIVTASYNYRYFPTTRGWAEMMRLGDLPQYAEGTGTDVEQFQSYQEAARQLLAGESTALRTPQQTAAWFATVARQVLDDVAAAAAAGEELEGRARREFLTTTTDLGILAHLAEYHAARMQAALWYNVYLQSEDEFALDKCLAAESEAVAAWKRIIAAAGNVYPETLKFGVHRVGFSWHWREELARLEDGYEKLKELPRRTRLDDATRNRLLERIKPPAGPPLSIHIERATSATPGQDLVITAVVDGSPKLEWIRLRYRHLTQFEDYQSLEMVWDPQLKRFAAAIPGDFIVPQWNVMYFVEALDQEGHGRKVPDLEEGMPYVVVPVKR